MLDTWVVTLSAVTSTGNLTQLYPSWAPTGVDPAAATAGQEIRTPVEGFLRAAQIMTDGINGGYIEIWDLNALDIRVDVSSGTTLTNANLVTLQNMGRAKLIWKQNFTATSGASIGAAFGKQFMHGLAARFVSGGGSCELNVDVEGGFRLQPTAGA